jgi:hypothetical protein
MGCTACTEPQCMYKGALYLLLYHQIYIYCLIHNHVKVKGDCYMQIGLEAYRRKQV